MTVEDARIVDGAVNVEDLSRPGSYRRFGLLSGTWAEAREFKSVLVMRFPRDILEEIGAWHERRLAGVPAVLLHEASMDSDERAIYYLGREVMEDFRRQNEALWRLREAWVWQRGPVARVAEYDLINDIS